MERLLFISSAISLILLSAPTIARESIHIDSLAHQLYQQGEYQAAFDLWSQVAQNYRDVKNNEAVTGAIVQMAQAQLKLGQLVNACFTLQRHFKLDGALCQPNRNSIDPVIPILKSENDILAMIALGRIIRDLGLIETSSQVLRVVEQAAHEANKADLLDILKIDQGNLLLLKLRLQRDREIYADLTTSLAAFNSVADQFEVAFQYYEAVSSPALMSEARIKWVNLYHELQRYSETYSLWNIDLLAEKNNLYSTKLEYLRLENFSKLTPIESLRMISEVSQIFYQDWKNTGNIKSQEEAFKRAQYLVNFSKNTNHSSFAAIGYGIIGNLLRDSNQVEKAIQVYQLASQKGNQLNTIYQWQYEIARLFQDLENEKQAERFYESAIYQLSEQQQDYLPHSYEIKANFQEKIRPIYDDYIEFQLRRAAPQWKTVLSVRDKLSQAAIENYLGCGTLKIIKSQELIHHDSNTILISIFKTNSDYYTIIQKHDLIEVSRTNRKEIDESIQRILFLLSGNQEIPDRLLQDQFSLLYKRIYQPVSSYVSQGETILFSNLDPQLQQIPMSLLFDGKSYLVEKNPIAFAGSTIYEPRPLPKNQQKILFMGLSQNHKVFTSFPKLPFIEREATAINPKQKLLNSSFTLSKFLKKLQQNFSIIHIASHGQFSSQLDQTFLLAYDDKILVTDLASSVAERAAKNPNPVELLVLSACETAKGDKQAVLGMAGLSIQAGARSTLASLWISEDESTALLMKYFYQYLRLGNTKAEALQFAQIELKQAGYSPYSWANFILLGSWL